MQDVALLLRDFVGKMATEVIAKNHPWRNICQLFATLDADNLDQALGQVYKCVLDAFGKSVVPLKETTLLVRLELVQILGHTDLPRAERLLRDILASGVCDPMVGLYLGNNLIGQGRYREAEQIELDMLSRIDQDESHVLTAINKAKALEFLAWCQHKLDKRAAAEKNLREAVAIYVYEWGTEDSVTIDTMVTLQIFLREWGHEAEADQLKLEIDKLIGWDEIDFEQ